MCEYTVGGKARCLSTDFELGDYFTKGNEYVVSRVDLDDAAMPIRVVDNDGDELWVKARCFEPA